MKAYYWEQTCTLWFSACNGTQLARKQPMDLFNWPELQLLITTVGADQRPNASLQCLLYDRKPCNCWESSNSTSIRQGDLLHVSRQGHALEDPHHKLAIL